MLRFLKNTVHLLSGWAAVIYYRFPARRLTVLGITGTDGKTTTTSLLYYILNRAGLRAAMITTVGADIAGTKYDNAFHVTTPNAWTLQKYLRQAADTGVTHVALEVSSHSLDQHRVVGIPFRAAALTNVTHEHLDYHKTYENYVRTKARLLRRAKVAFANRDDGSFELVTKLVPTSRLRTYAIKQAADLTPATFPFSTNLIGEFNRYNALAAIALAREIGVDEELIRDALTSFEAPEGRQKIVYNKEFKVIIDFAHTPNAFEQILPAVRAMTPGRLIHVFGCPGLRDSGKRPLMGAVAARYDDIIVLTAEDPRGENVEDINAAIRAPITDFEFRKDALLNASDKKIIGSVPDRRSAIQQAIASAVPGDTVLLTGKSHEKSMNYDGTHEEPWDETKEALAALRR